MGFWNGFWARHQGVFSGAVLGWALVCVVLLFLAPTPPRAAEAGRSRAEVRVAVAANFIRAMAELIRSFQEERGIRVVPIYGSTGQLYSMIKNGAPVDLFLAADRRRPGLLHRDGICGPPEVYAKGEVVLWSRKRGVAEEHDWKAALAAGRAGRIAIPSPETAPYGHAAQIALRRAGLYARLAPRLIYAQSVAQAFQYVEMEGADLGFVALSYVVGGRAHSGGRYWHIPEAPPILQAMCLVERTQTPIQRKRAEAFMEFLHSRAGRAILARFGYR